MIYGPSKTECMWEVVCGKAGLAEGAVRKAVAWEGWPVGREPWLHALPQDECESLGASSDCIQACFPNRIPRNFEQTQMSYGTAAKILTRDPSVTTLLEVVAGGGNKTKNRFIYA